MLIAIDKRGSINLPAALRKELGLVKGSYLELVVEEGSAIRLQPVCVYPVIRLNEKGLNKLKEARQSGKDTPLNGLYRILKMPELIFSKKFLKDIELYDI